MLRSKKTLYFLTVFSLFSFFLSAKETLAAPEIRSFLLNGSAQNITFNPNNGESISIEVKANEPVKFTRLYICSINQACNGTSGNYTRYFTQSDISDTISKTWNGKKSGDTEIVPAGEYKIMVSMVEGANPAVTAFGQYSIFVDFSTQNNSTTTDSSGSNGNTQDQTSTTTSSSTQSTNSQNQNIVTRIVYVSTHSRPEELSNYNEATPFEISAGRERLSLVGSSVEFDAKYNLSKKGECDPKFEWSFGDGLKAGGSIVRHIYKYDGEYQIVLNGTCGEYSSVSRSKIKIISPNISISSILSDDIQLNNNSGNEINIGNWKIIGGGKEFIFSDDTIIGGGKRIIISKDDLGVDSSTTRLSLINPANKEITAIILAKTVVMASEITEVKAYTDEITVNEAEKLAENYKKTLANEDEHPELFSLSNEPAATSSNKDMNIEDTKENENTNQTATVFQPENISMWQKIISLPVQGIKSLFGIFYDF